MNRRDFLRYGAAGATSPLWAAPVRKFASDRIRLGPSRIEVSRLAQGSGTHGYAGSSNQTRKLGLRGLAGLFTAAYDQGVTFWDTADQYGSHPHVREALRRVPRERVAILSKTNATTARETRADIDRFRRELGTDYIDILLLHAMTGPDWPERFRGAMDAITEAREKGIVRTHGASCHTVEALRAATRHPWAQVNMARINPAQAAMDTDPQTAVAALREMKAAGKGVIGMKILGQGNLRDRVDQCLAFALSLDCLDCFTVGAESHGELLDLVKRMPAASLRG
ncbi:MAG: aldo/keto reductase [Acidobacteria bacterium]|nr:aldo/keto reductase [Acidobacteriota bacterium]